MTILYDPHKKNSLKTLSKLYEDAVFFSFRSFSVTSSLLVRTGTIRKKNCRVETGWKQEMNSRLNFSIKVITIADFMAVCLVFELRISSDSGYSVRL